MSPAAPAVPRRIVSEIVVPHLVGQPVQESTLRPAPREGLPEPRPVNMGPSTAELTIGRPPRAPRPEDERR